MGFFYGSEQEIEQVVRGFETCATAAGDFHHREHLTVAVWYLQTLSPRETVVRMRAALLRFLDHHGVDRGKYSEDVTVFWVDAVARHLEEGIGAQASLLEKCNQVIGAFVSSKAPTSGVSSKAPTSGVSSKAPPPVVSSKASTSGGSSKAPTSGVSSPVHKPGARVEGEESLAKS